MDNAKTPVNTEKLKKKIGKDEGDKPSKRLVSNRLSTALLLLPLLSMHWASPEEKSCARTLYHMHGPKTGSPSAGKEVSDQLL